MFAAIKEVDIIQKKADWAFKWIQSSNSFAERLVAFALVEGVFFSSSFAAIFYMKKRGLLPFLTFLNELISRDEGAHVMTAVMIYKKLLNPLPEERIHEIVKDAVRLEVEFTKESLPCDLIGMNSRLMQEHVQSVADKITEMLGYRAVYNSKTPFEFMTMLDMAGKTNFFESRVS